MDLIRRFSRKWRQYADFWQALRCIILIAVLGILAFSALINMTTTAQEDAFFRFALIAIGILYGWAIIGLTKDASKQYRTCAEHAQATDSYNRLKRLPIPELAYQIATLEAQRNDLQRTIEESRATLRAAEDELRLGDFEYEIALRRKLIKEREAHPDCRR